MCLLLPKRDFLKWLLPEVLWSPIQATDCIGHCSLFHQLQTDNWGFLDMEKERKTTI